ncbi:MAG: DinB family protein [Phycisphaerae bacterium]|nr:DinB family protein [Phycisphaerae bacterium]
MSKQRTTVGDASIDLLLHLIDEAYDRKAWHGPNLRGALRTVDAAQATWRPHARRHCIAEIAVHCAYWKYAARRRFRGEKRGAFPLAGSNWFKVPPRLSAQEWRGYLALLDEQHRALRAAVESLPVRRLSEVPKGARITNRTLIAGIAAHDVYHAGQIRLLKSLHGG